MVGKIQLLFLTILTCIDNVPSYIAMHLFFVFYFAYHNINSSQLCGLISSQMLIGKQTNSIFIDMFQQRQKSPSRWRLIKFTQKPKQRLFAFLTITIMHFFA